VVGICALGDLEFTEAGARQKIYSELSGSHRLENNVARKVGARASARDAACPRLVRATPRGTVHWIVPLTISVTGALALLGASSRDLLLARPPASLPVCTRCGRACR
jgi:hypothetical protein